MPGLVATADAAGLVPTATEVLSFKVPQVLGGTATVENLEVSDFVVALNIAGQIHHQVKDLPSGTTITGFKGSDQSAQNCARNAADQARSLSM